MRVLCNLVVSFIVAWGVTVGLTGMPDWGHDLAWWGIYLGCMISFTLIDIDIKLEKK